ALRRDDRRLRDRVVQARPPALVGVLRTDARGSGAARARRRQSLPRRRSGERARPEERLGESARGGRRSAAGARDSRPERPRRRAGRARSAVKIPAGYVVRPLAEDDAPEVARLVSAFEEAYMEEPDVLDADEVATWWRDLDLATDSLAFLGRDG